jgi:hypothetical protein
MAQFSVNAQRFDPYKNFKFRVKWDGRYVAGVSKVSALKRTTEVVEHREGGDPSTSRKSPGRTKYEAITLERGVTHDTSSSVGEQGLELRRRPRRGGLAQGLPQGHHHRGLQRGRPARDRLQGLPLLGLGVPGAARSRRQRQRRGDPDAQARERGLGARHDVTEPTEPRLAGRCVVEARRGGEPVEAEEMSDEELTGLSEALAEADPGAELLFDLGCPACGAAWQQVLDVASFLWEELEAQAHRVLGEVHVLARAYGWRRGMCWR